MFAVQEAKRSVGMDLIWCARGYLLAYEQSPVGHDRHCNGTLVVGEERAHVRFRF